MIVQQKSPILLRFTTYNIQDGEPFFFQHLIMKISARSEHELLDGNTTYRDRFCALFPTRYNQAIKSLCRSYIEERNSLSRTYDLVLRSLLPDLENRDLSDLIINQFLSLEKHRPHLDTRSSLILDTEQYKIYSTLCNVWRKNHDRKYPYFFLTGSAETGK